MTAKNGCLPYNYALPPALQIAFLIIFIVTEPSNTKKFYILWRCSSFFLRETYIRDKKYLSEKMTFRAKI